MIEWIVSSVTYLVEHWQTIVGIGSFLCLHFYIVESQSGRRSRDTSHESGGQSDY